MNARYEYNILLDWIAVMGIATSEKVMTFSQSVETLRSIYIACLLWYCERKQWIFKIHFKLKVFVQDCFKIKKITFFQIQN